MEMAAAKQNIPKGWRETKLSELLVEVNERNRERAELPVLSVTNSRGFVLQSEQFARNVHSKNTSNYKIVSKEQFAYNPARINVGSIALLRKWEKGLLSPMYVVFGTKDELLNDYLQYYIQSPRFSVQVSNNTAGSVRKSLNFNTFEHFDYVYPESKHEQKKIVEVLASVDEEIKKTKEVIKATEKLKKGLMQKLFTQGIGHTKFKQTELGEIPESWKVVEFKNVVSFKTGKLNSNAAVEDGQYPFFTCSQETYRTNTFAFDQEAILLAGNNAAGKYSVKHFKGKFDAYQRTYVITILDQKQLNYVFFKEVLQEKLKELKNSSFGSTTKFLTLKLLESLKMKLPPIEEQEKIAEVLSSIDNKILVNNDLLAKQKELKKGLMQDLLTGVKRVKV